MLDSLYPTLEETTGEKYKIYENVLKAYSLILPSFNWECYI